MVYGIRWALKDNVGFHQKSTVGLWYITARMLLITITTSKILATMQMPTVYDTEAKYTNKELKEFKRIKCRK